MSDQEQYKDSMAKYWVTYGFKITEDIFMLEKSSIICSGQHSYSTHSGKKVPSFDTLKSISVGF